MKDLLPQPVLGAEGIDLRPGRLRDVRCERGHVAVVGRNGHRGRLGRERNGIRRRNTDADVQSRTAASEDGRDHLLAALVQRATIINVVHIDALSCTHTAAATVMVDSMTVLVVRVRPFAIFSGFTKIISGIGPLWKGIGQSLYIFLLHESQFFSIRVYFDQ